MKSRELVQRVAEEVGLNTKTVKAVLYKAAEVVEETPMGDKTSFPGLGVFFYKKHAPRVVSFNLPWGKGSKVQSEGHVKLKFRCTVRRDK